MRTSLRPTLISTLIVPLAALTLMGACGSSAKPSGKLASAGGATTTTVPGAAVKADPTKFAQCMREHGIDMLDPTNGGGGVIKIESDESGEIGADGMPVGGDKFQDALEQCQPLMPTGIGGQGGVPDELKKQLLDMAECMRGNGFPEFADPDFTSGSVIVGGPKAPVTDKEKFDATMANCSKDTGLGAFQAAPVGGASSGASSNG